MHVGCERGDDQSAAALARDLQDLLCDFLLRDGKVFDAGIGGIAHEQIDPDLSHVCHDLIIGIQPDRGQVELEIAGLDDAPVGRIDQYAQRIGNGMDRVEKAHGEMLHVDR